MRYTSSDAPTLFRKRNIIWMNQKVSLYVLSILYFFLLGLIGLSDTNIQFFFLRIIKTNVLKKIFTNKTVF